MACNFQNYWPVPYSYSDKQSHAFPSHDNNGILPQQHYDALQKGEVSMQLHNLLSLCQQIIRGKSNMKVLEVYISGPHTMALSIVYKVLHVLLQLLEGPG